MNKLTGETDAASKHRETESDALPSLQHTRPHAPTGGVRHLVAATANSLRGIRDALGGTAFRQECAIGVAHYVAIFLVPMRVEFRLALAAAWATVLAAELLNTAVEAVVDLVSPEWHPLARRAKDAASASVFVLILLSLALWAAALTGVR